MQPAYICLPSVKWSGWQELHLRPPRSEQGRLLLTLHPEIGASGGTCTHTLPADNGLLFYSATEAEMVGSAGNAPARHFRLRLRHPIYSRAAGSLPLVAGVGVTPT